MKSVTKDRFHVSSRLASGRGKGGAVGMRCTLFGIAVRRYKCGRTG